MSRVVTTLSMLLVPSAVGAVLTGDCDASGAVSIFEVQRCANLFVSPQAAQPCPACDQNSDGEVAINEVQIAANCFLNAGATGCREVVGPTPSATATAPTPPPATPTLPLPAFVQGEIDVQVFTSDDGTTYYVFAVDLRQGSAGIGAQITSVALSTTDVTTFAETFTPGDPVLTAVATAATGTMPPLDRLWRTRVLTGLPFNDVSESDFAPAANNGRGILFLPGGGRAVTLTGLDGGTEEVFPLIDRGDGAACLPPCSVTTQVTRQFNSSVRGDTITFPVPEARCVGGTTPGRVCVVDDDCDGTIVNPGRCGQPSRGASCGPPSFIPCDPRQAPSVQCSGGVCSDLGGEVAGGQNITLDDTIGSRVGNPESQGADAVDGFFLRDGVEAVVLIAEAGVESPALNAAATGFIVAGECAGSRGLCKDRFDCGGAACRVTTDVLTTVSTVRGEGTGTGPPGTPGGVLSLIGVGLDSAFGKVTAIALDPAGANMYIGRQRGLQVFNLDPVTGELADEVQNFSRGELPGLDVLTLLVSPDGQTVYLGGATVGNNGNVLASLSRDPVTGRLGEIEDVVRYDPNGADGGLSGVGTISFTGIRTMLLSRDGRNVYVETETIDEGSGEKRAAIAAFLRDSETHELSLRGILGDTQSEQEVLLQAGLMDVASMVASHDDRFVYAASERGNAAVRFERNPGSGELTFAGPGTFVTHQAGVADGLVQPTSIEVSPDDETIFVGDGNTVIGAFQSLAAGFAFNEGEIAAGFGVKSLAVSDSKNGTVPWHVYAGCGRGLAVFEPDLFQFGCPTRCGLQSGGLKRVQTIDGFGSPEIIQASDVAVRAGGRHVYVVSNVLSESTIIAFRRDQATGVLNDGIVHENSRLGIPALLGSARSFAVSSAGDRVYVAASLPISTGEFVGSVGVFRREAISGRLSLDFVQSDVSGGLSDITFLAELVLAPDDAHAYVIGVGTPGNAILVFEVDGGGALRFQQALRDGRDNVQGVSNAAALIVNEIDDVEYVYAAGGRFLTVFRRNSQADRMDYLQTLENEVEGVEGLSDARALALSPDGRHVYVASAADGFTGSPGTLSVFSREGSGRLRYEQVVDPSQEVSVASFEGASLAVSPDGRNVYTMGRSSDRFDGDAILVFRRDEVTGYLTFVHYVDDLAVLSLAASNGFVYANGSDSSSSLTAFRRDDEGKLTLAQELFAAPGLGLGGPIAVASSGQTEHVYVGGSPFGQAAETLAAYRVNEVDPEPD